MAQVLWPSVLCHFCLTTELIFAKCSRLSGSPSSPGVVQAGDYPCVTQQSLVRGGTGVPWSLCLAGQTLLWLGRGEDPEPDTPECSARVPSFPSHVSGRADQRDAASEQDLGAQSVRAAENTPGNHRTRDCWAWEGPLEITSPTPCPGRVTQNR